MFIEIHGGPRRPSILDKPPDPRIQFLEILSDEERRFRSDVVAAVDEMLTDLDSLGGVKDYRVGVLRQHFIRLREMQLEGCRKYIREFKMDTSEKVIDQEFVKQTKELEEKVAKLTAP